MQNIKIDIDPAGAVFGAGPAAGNGAGGGKKQEVLTEYTEEQAIQRAKIAENIALWI